MDAPSACDSAKGRQERPMPPRKACDGCFRRKIRCLLPQSGSPCDWCKNQRISCTFARESQSSHRLSPTAVQDLLNRVEQLEAELASKNAQALTPASIPAQRTPGADRYQETVPSNSPAGTFSQATPFSSHEASFPSNPVSPPVLQDRISRSEATFETWVGCGWFLRGLPILSRDGEKWLSAKTGQNVTFEHLSPPRQPTRGATIREAEIIKLPEEWEVRELAKVYFESSLYQIGPILDPALFDETIHTAYASPGYTAEYRSAAACILVFCELLGHLNGKSFHQETSQPGSGRRLGQLDLLTEELDLHHLQALLLVIFYDASIQNRKSRHRLLSVACQAIIDMNGHVLHQRSEQPSEDDFSQGLRRYARSIFWHCYRLDKDIALRHGRPPILTQEHCDLTLPEENGTSWLLPDRHSQSMMGHYLSAASRLSVIKEHVCRLLFPASATHIDDNQILLHIRHLDDELEKWRAALPLGIQPRLSIDGDYVASSPSPNSSWGDLALALQLDYSHTFIMIHTAIRKCGHATSDKEDVPEDLHQVIHSSINLSLEAARSTLKLLGHCATTKGLNFPRYLTSYVPPAAFALFLNIVIHPYDRHGPADLTLLTTFVGTVQGSDLGEVADENMELLQRLCEALMEFVRLGNSAIWQAKREARKPN